MAQTLLQIGFSLESGFRCTSPILGKIGGKAPHGYRLDVYSASSFAPFCKDVQNKFLVWRVDK